MAIQIQSIILNPNSTVVAPAGYPSTGPINGMSPKEYAFRLKYPFIDLAITLVPQVISNLEYYEGASCAFISDMSNAGMKICDYLTTVTMSQFVPCQVLLGDMWDMFWQTWVLFNYQSALVSSQSVVPTSPQTVTVNQYASNLVNQLIGWDEGRQPNTFGDLGALGYTIFSGVSP